MKKISKDIRIEGKKAIVIIKTHGNPFKFKEILADCLKRGDFLCFDTIFNKIKEKKAKFELIKNCNFIRICMTRGYLPKFVSLLEEVPKENWNEIVKSGNLVSFLITYHNSIKFDSKVLKEFMNFFMKIDFDYCLESYEKCKGGPLNTEVTNCIDSIIFNEKKATKHQEFKEKKNIENSAEGVDDAEEELKLNQLNME